MNSQYQILDLLGQGQFGRVFRAVHIPTGHLVALKELEKKDGLLINFFAN